MDSRVYRGAVVGFARMGLTHFSILNSHPEVHLVAVCDSSHFILKNATRCMDVRTYGDVSKMLDAVILDFNVVATPTVDHASVVMGALEKQLHVFVEKPFVLNARRGQEILGLLSKRPVINQVGYVLRFSDVFMQVKGLLESRVIGDLLRFKMEMNGPTVLHGAKSSWRSRKSERGSCLCDFGSHAIDLIHYLVGVPDKAPGLSSRVSTLRM